MIFQLAALCVANNFFHNASGSANALCPMGGFGQTCR